MIFIIMRSKHLLALNRKYAIGDVNRSTLPLSPWLAQEQQTVSPVGRSRWVLFARDETVVVVLVVVIVVVGFGAVCEFCRRILRLLVNFRLDRSVLCRHFAPLVFLGGACFSFRKKKEEREVL